MTLPPEAGAAAVAIMTQYYKFAEQTGLVPNLLLVGVNAPDAVAEITELFGMRVLADDILKTDYAVAYVL